MEAPGQETARRRSLSFLDLPYEIRRQIYEPLLYCNKVVKEICLATNTIFLPKQTNQKEEASPLLFPAILQTCQLLHEETAQVLYAENEFYLAIDHDPDRIARSWFMADRNLARVARLDLSIRLFPEINKDGLTLEKVAKMFPRLHSIAIYLCLTVPAWEEFVKESAAILKGMRQGRVVVDVGDDKNMLGPPGEASQTTKARCLSACKPVVDEYMPEKAIRWEFRKDEYVFGTYLEVYLVWGGVEVSGDFN